MPYEYYEGSVFECAEYNQVGMIVNTVNCKGVMGAGLALEFKLRYPDMFKDYKKKCLNDQIIIGELDMYSNSKVRILNFPTKDDWKKPSKMDWIESGLQSFAEQYPKYNIQSIAFPKLGTNNGGLPWKEVSKLMEKYFDGISDIKVYICLDTNEPRGTEGEMLTIVNQMTERELINLGIRINVIENFKKGSPFKRFFQVSKVQGLGSKSYEKLHDYCYRKGLKNEGDIDEDNNEQLTLF